MIPVDNPKTTLSDPSTNYCSQRRGKNSLPSTTDEKVELLGKILQKPLLCRHDIDLVNTIFRQIDSESDSHDLATNMVIDKISEVASKKLKSVQDIISLYHLQRFNLLEIDSIFQAELKDFATTPEILEEMAAVLPCCDSVVEFDNDVRSLFGSRRSERVERILNKKKEKIKSASEPMSLEKFPSLNAHLQKMKSLNTRNDRSKAIENMTFSEISTIVIETKEAIVSKVGRLPEGKRILFLIGGTGVGKSTVLCSIRGDKMVFHRDRYVSQSDRDGIIGNDGATSCTFLPNIGYFGDWVFIDFAGFEDTHGALISLGMEMALKELINRNQSKVLVLESITNTEGRFAAAALLGQRLNRIFHDKSQCVLGITKFNLERNFIQIKMLEEKEQQSASSKEEKDLEIEIKVLQGLKNADLKEVIEEKRKRLKQLKNTKSKGKEEIGVSDSAEIKEYRKALGEKVQELKRQIGLDNAIQFCDLEDEENVAFCMTELEVLTRGNVTIDIENRLDPHVRELLDKIFMKQLLELLKSKEDYSFAFSEFHELEQSILNFSLIQTLLSESHPEIGKFLHLPEMDPRVVMSYDKQVVRDCIQKYTDAVISTLDIAYIDTLLEQVVINRSGKKSLKEKIARLQNYIVAITGQTWDQLRDRLKGGSESLESKFQLPKWLQACCNMPLGIPRGLLTIFQNNEMVRAQQNELDNVIAQSCRDVDAMYEILLKLKQIEKVIEKRDQLDGSFYSNPISVDSQEVLYQSMASRIAAIRSIYGAEEWDKHVSFMLDRLKFYMFDSKKEGHVPCLLSYVYFLLERGTSCIYEVDMVHEAAEDKPETSFEAKARSRFETIITELEIIDASLTKAFEVSEIYEKMKTIHNITQFDANQLTRQSNIGFPALQRANLFDFAVQNVVLAVRNLNEENVQDFKNEIQALLKAAHTELLIRSKKIAARTTSQISWSDAKAKAREENDALVVKNFKWTIKSDDQKLEVVGEGELPELPLEIAQLQRPLDKALAAAALLKYFESLK